MKKTFLLILGMVLTMNLCACNNTDGSEKEVKKSSIEIIENNVDDLETEIENVYIDALMEIIGDANIEDITYDDAGIYVEDEFVSFEYIEEIAYNNLHDNL